MTNSVYWDEKVSHEWVGATINTLAADNLSVPVGTVQN